MGIGVAAIAAGVAATIMTGGAAGTALVAGVKTAVTIGAVSAGTSGAVTGITAIASGDKAGTVIKKVLKPSVDGFCGGFMTGGITAGMSMTAGALLKHSNGIRMGQTSKSNHGKVDTGYGSTSKDGGFLI